MNKTKRGLIITAIVLNFCSIALNTYIAILSFITTPVVAANIFFGVYELLSVAAYVIANVLLIYAIADGGTHFRQRNAYYVSAVIMILVLNLFSVSSILLVVTMFMSDWVWVKPKQDVYDVPPQEPQDDQKEKERKIATLRRLKEEGKISEEEFNDQLFKLL